MWKLMTCLFPVEISCNYFRDFVRFEIVSGRLWRMQFPCRVTASFFRAQYYLENEDRIFFWIVGRCVPDHTVSRFRNIYFCKFVLHSV
jgi:hypothetical protein